MSRGGADVKGSPWRGPVVERTSSDTPGKIYVRFEDVVSRPVMKKLRTISRSASSPCSSFAMNLDMTSSLSLFSPSPGRPALMVGGDDVYGECMDVGIV